MTFGERIKSLRTEATMTMRDLGKEVGCSASYIHQIETKGIIPSPERVDALAFALECNHQDLLDSAMHDLLDNAHTKILRKYSRTHSRSIASSSSR